MYCSRCGKEIDNKSNYCMECGFKVNPDKEDLEKDKMLLKIKPIFNKMISVTEVENNQIVFTVLMSVLFGMYTVAYFFSGSIPGALIPFIFLLYGFVFFGISVSSKYYFDKNTIDATEYRFYKNKLEYFEGFSTMEQKIIKYHNVTEIYLRRSMLQKKNNLGTIIISTPITSLKSNGAMANGVVLKNVENPNETYKKIRNLINEAN